MQRKNLRAAAFLSASNAVAVFYAPGDDTGNKLIEHWKQVSIDSNFNVVLKRSWTHI